MMNAFDFEVAKAHRRGMLIGVVVGFSVCFVPMLMFLVFLVLTAQGGVR